MLKLNHLLLSSCYNSQYPKSSPGVFLSSLSLSLVWQHSSLLEGDLACLSQLLQRSKSWRFYVNVVGSEYPVMTNLQLIERLRQVRREVWRVFLSVVEVRNSVGLVDVVRPWSRVQDRWRYSYQLPESGQSAGNHFTNQVSL